MSNIELNKISDYELYAFGKTLTQKERNKINSVFKRTDIYDKNSNDGRDILETQEELFDFSRGIGEELYGRLKDFIIRQKDVEKIQSKINDCSVYNEKEYTKSIKSINTQNVTGVFADGCDIGNHLACYDGNDNLILWRSEDKVKEDLNYVRTVLQSLCKQNGIDTSVLDKEDFKYTKEDGFWSCDSDGLLEKYLGLINDTNYLKNNINPILNEDNSHRLENAIENRYNEMLKDPQKNENLNNYDLGNGKLDGMSTQRANNCWICAGLNSLVSTPVGKAFLEKNIIRDNTRHITAVYIRGAENEGLPKPKGDGIYTFSDNEIVSGQDTLAYGDGDFTAYNLAINRYLNETDKYNSDNGKNLYLENGAVQGTYEILTGLSDNENRGNTGVSTIPRDFKTIYDIVKTGKGAVCLSDEDHAYSVVGTDDSGELLIQESNQDPDWEKNKKFEYIKDSSPPTYKLSKEKLEQYFVSSAVFQWAK